MYAFDYLRPTSVSEAVSMMRDHPGAKLLAGGQSLLPTLKQRLAMHEQLIDIGGLEELCGERIEGDRLRIGAGTRHADVASSSLVKQSIPALASLAGMIGDPLVRHMGTLGGSVANNDPSADYPGACLALDAEIETSARRLSADSFFTGMFETQLADDEILAAVRFRIPQRAVYLKFPNPASRYAMAGVFLARFDSGVRVAVTGAGATAFRLGDYEAALNQNFSVRSIDALAPDPGQLMGDVHASPEYRAQLIRVLAKRAVLACLS